MGTNIRHNIVLTAMHTGDKNIFIGCFQACAEIYQRTEAGKDIYFAGIKQWKQLFSAAEKTYIA